MNGRDGRTLHVAVVGAGVIGLSVAAHLVELALPERLVVTLIADKFSPHTASDKSGGLVVPPDVPAGVDASRSDRQEKRWVCSTFKRLHTLYNSENGGEVGLKMVHGYYPAKADSSVSWWKDVVLGFRAADDSEAAMLSLQGKPIYAFSSYTVQVKTYLPWLLQCFIKAGGIARQAKVNNLSELSSYDIVINCTGIGAAQLVDDPMLYPAAGHVVSVKAPWVTQFFLEPLSGKYRAQVFPHIDSVFLGGTFDSKNISLDVAPEEVAEIMRRCQAVVPSLSGAEIVDTWVGVRPMRKGGVRLEREEGTHHPVVIHCYGHGHRGVSASWGCAEEVGGIVADFVKQATSKL